MENSSSLPAIAVVTNTTAPPLAGVGIYTQELMRSMVQLGHQVWGVGVWGTESLDQLERRCSQWQQHGRVNTLRWAHLLLRTAVGSHIYEYAARRAAEQGLEALTKAWGDGAWVAHVPTLERLPRLDRSLRGKWRLVCTVHDLSHRHEPLWHPSERVGRLRRAEADLRRADAVIAVSRFTADKLIEFQPGLAGRTHVVQNGLRRLPAVEAVPPEARRGVLCVSTIEPRKNLLALIEAHARLPKAIREAHPLTLIGGFGWGGERLRAQLMAAQARGALTWTGFVGELELAEAYAKARVFAYPSLYEGFGLPVLEAQAAGTPVIVGRHSGLTEVAGPGALLLDDVEDREELGSALLLALERDGGSEMWEERRAFASRFTWERTALETARIFAGVSTR